MPIDRNSAQYITGAIYKPTQTSAPGVWDLDDQANNIVKNLWPLPPQAVQRSLRFNSADSAYLNRTPASAGNRTTWTWSAWVKRAGLYTTNAGPTLFDAGPNNSNFAFVRFLSDSQDKLDFGWIVSNSTAGLIRSNASFRDPSSWYHIVAVLDTNNATSTDRMRLYVNGQRITSFLSTSYPAQGTATCHVNATNVHYLGRSVESSYRYMDDYMAEVNFIDGQALDATSFGETDPQTGVWIPKRYTGNYGTNGFRLSFANNSSTTALGYDSSGQGNNWTANNFSVTPGTGNDSLLDVPSLYGTDTGLGGEVLGNYCTWNPLDKDTNVTLANGNLDLTAYNQGVYATWSLTSGKWYYELTLIDPYNGGGSINFWGYHGLIGVQRSAAGLNVSSFSGIYCNTDTADNNAPGIYQLGTRILAYTTFANSDIIGLAADIDNKTLTIYRNGTVIRSNITLANISTFYIWSGMNGTSGDPGTTSVNFGQRPFAYPAPTGYKALCTTNLPAPAIGQTSNNRAGNYFNVVTYTGDGAASKSITGVGFQPDLVWIKSRTNASGYHILVDSVRGAGLWMATNATAGDSTAGQLVSSLDANGFSLNLSPNNTVNELNANYVAWCWKKSRAAGFDVVTTTANASAVVTYNHSLGVSPAFVISKSRSATVPWLVYHKSLGANQYLLLNTLDAATTLNGVYSSSLSQFSITSQTANASYVAYMFAEIPGFSAFGSYTGNGSTDGPFIYLGFRPAWIMIKRSDAIENWNLYDNKRNPYNVADLELYPNLSNSEGTTADRDFLSNGFKIRSSNAGRNASGGTYIYAAFAETPARLSTAR